MIEKMVSSTFASYSQNGEDVVLWRALRDVHNGRYIDVGANHPEIFSVSMGFYERGWSGITVEPDPAFAQMQRVARPRDSMVEAAATAKDGDTITFHVVDGTGLSTLDQSLAQAHEHAGYDTHDVEVRTRTINSILEEADWKGLDIHFMSIDTEGSEKGVLEGVDFSVWRPWVLVIEATTPLTTQSTRQLWEELVLDADYRFCLFDGLSCCYVAEEHADSLGSALSYPACPLDDYTSREYRKTVQEMHELVERVQTIPDLMEQVTRWRAQAMTRWATAIATETELERIQVELEDLREVHHALMVMHHEEDVSLRQQIAELHQSSSWRLTKPLRLLSELVSGKRRRQ
jgi:FkbM family methyltransferase